MWESPIQMITDDIVQKQDGCLVECVHRVGFDVDKEELAKALAYDRDQYEKGYSDGRWARDSEIVRCKDCRHCSEIDNKEVPYHALFCDYWFDETEEDTFCSYGERKETEDE